VKSKEKYNTFHARVGTCEALEARVDNSNAARGPLHNSLVALKEALEAAATEHTALSVKIVSARKDAQNNMSAMMQ
jgi:hypothetical protein